MKYKNLLLSLLFVGFIQNSMAAIVYVDQSATGGNNGSSWNDAFTLLENALAFANQGDEIWVAAATYHTPTTNGYIVAEGISLYGGFNGTESLLTQRNWNANATGLTGFNGPNSNYVGQAEHILNMNTPTGNIGPNIVDGFIIEGSLGTLNGGGIIAEARELNVHNCILTNNQVDQYGAAMFIQNSSLDIANCLIFANRTLNSGLIPGTGGAAIVFNSTGTDDMIIKSVTIADNMAVNGVGGAILIGAHGNNIEIENSIIYGNVQGDGTDHSIKSQFGIATSIDYISNIIYDGSNLTGNLNYFNISNVDPLFLGNGSYELHFLSPAIEAGNTNIGNLDLNHNPRVYNGSIDLGSYEFQECIIYVNPSATGNNDGSSWANAYTVLEDALTNAWEDCEVWVVAGTYNPLEDIGFEIVNDGVEVYGGFNGTESLRSQRNWNTNVTILSGNAGLNSNFIGVSETVVLLDQPGGSNLNVIDGFTIRDGKSGYRGGGIYSDERTLRISHCIIRDNSATDFGGGFYAEDTSLDLENCLIINNKTTSGNGGPSGGAGLAFNGTAVNTFTISNTTIADNEAENLGVAGAMVIGGTNGDISIYNSIFYGNTQDDGSNHSIKTEFSITTTIDYAEDIIYDGPNLTGSLNYINISSANPLFVGGGSYELQALSPAKDAGNNTNAVGTIDLKHHQRIFGSSVDLGAYEHGAPLARKRFSTIAETANISTFSVYPNPTQGRITIEGNSPIHSIELFDQSGRLVKRFNATNSKMQQLEMYDIPEGIYLLRTLTTDKLETSKLIIQQ